MDFKIVPMNENHVKEIAEIERECFSDPWSEVSISSELQKDGSVYFVAVSNEGVLGYCGLNFVLDEGYITNIAVRASLRGNGIGTALLKALISRSKELSLAFVSLEVRVSNEKAISLYESFGFKTVGMRKSFYQKPKEDANLMTLYL